MGSARFLSVSASHFPGQGLHARSSLFIPPRCMLPTNENKSKVELSGTMPPRGSHETDTVQRNVNCRDPETSRCGAQGQRPLSGTWDQRGHVLQLESQVRGAWGFLPQMLENHERRTDEAQADVCGYRLRESGAEEFARKKLSPSPTNGRRSPPCKRLTASPWSAGQARGLIPVRVLSRSQGLTNS